MSFRAFCFGGQWLRGRGGRGPLVFWSRAQDFDCLPHFLPNIHFVAFEQPTCSEDIVFVEIRRAGFRGAHCFKG